MYRCRIEKQSWEHSKLTPASGELDRLRRVLRLKDGAMVNVFDGHGRSGWARFTVDPADGVACLCRTERDPGSVAAPLPVVLFQSIPKATRMDWLVEKATELGVAEIVPLITERCVVRPTASQRGGNRLSRWRRLAQQAARQCGMDTVPKICEPLNFNTALEQVAGRSLAGLYGSLQPDALDLRRVFEEWQGSQVVTALFIGPEGDFTPDEYGCLRAAGMTAVNLGPRILRVETAALAALCIIGYELAWPDQRNQGDDHGVSRS